jgi:radical SAM protein with 4Fe4S-binding SPASM domain
VAKEKGIRLGWRLEHEDWLDFRPDEEKIAPLEGKSWDREWEQRLKLYHPGFCKHVAKGLRVTTDGNVAPCGMSTGPELRLGSLAEQDFEEIWNGPSARDLRRAHYTADYASLCSGCRFSDRSPPLETMPFVERFIETLGQGPSDVEAVLRAGDPPHMSRLSTAPVVGVEEPPSGIARWFVVFALGGGVEQIESCELEPTRTPAGGVELHVPDELWGRLRTNLGYWWCVIAVPAAEDAPVLRSSEIRCVVSHEPIVRIDGSTLHYPDGGHAPLTYLGGDQQIGWLDRDRLPSRPKVARRGTRVRKRFSKRNGNGTPGRMSADAYAGIIARVRATVDDVVPEDATVLVASKGDDELTMLGGRRARHFPATDDGVYLGHHPADDDSAIAELERLRAEGADYLVLPATVAWWLEHYRRFADFLHDEGVTVAEDSACVVFDLRAGKDSTGAHGERSLVADADRLLGPSGQHARFWQRLPAIDGDDVLPRFAAEASGCELVDTEGRRFVDWVNGGGPVVLGYRHPAVEEAISSQFAAGPTLTLPHAVQVDVAAKLTETIPCAEMVAFGKNGSDAVTAAVRLARAATGRERILQFGVHGFHDWHVAARPGVLGIPKALRALVRSFPYNDLERLEALFDELDGDVAAVVMEPVTVQLPRPGYLEGVRELTRRRGALLVFDEMVTGFRLAPGGRQELYGVVPDLACFGKALANGMPLSAVVGRREYMELLPRIAYGMTFRGETLSLAAAAAVLRTMRAEPVVEHLAPVAEELRAARAEVRRAIEAATSEDVPRRGDGVPGGALDVVAERDGSLYVEGWMLFGDDAPDAIEFVSAAGEVQLAERRRRPDLALAFPGVPGAESCGFAVMLPARSFAPSGDFEFVVRARPGGTTVFACPVRRAGGDVAGIRRPRFGADRTLEL